MAALIGLSAVQIVSLVGRKCKTNQQPRVNANVLA